MFCRILLTFTFARADTVSSYTRACPLTNGHPLYSARLSQYLPLFLYSTTVVMEYEYGIPLLTDTILRRVPYCTVRTSSFMPSPEAEYYKNTVLRTV